MNVFGGLLADPDKRFKAGTGRFLRRLEFRDIEEVDDVVVLEFLSQAFVRLPYFKENWHKLRMESLC